ncbi:MAG: glycerol-3-phosphate acyltransferase [Chloroflexi bacterium]|nr:glycerol-3-phosphate acyltransferase [Chloroflexota bacterium]
MIANEIVAVIVAAGASYLLGSLPFAVLVSRMAGVDIFEVGTANPGASNVFRKVGRVYGAAVFALDILKGLVAVLAGMLLGCPDVFLPVASSFAIVGHWLPIFMRFKGGAGLATGLGVGVALLGWWGLIPTVAGLAALPLIKDGPRSAAVTFAVAVVVGLATGPHWIALGGMVLILALLLGRLFLVEFPRDRRGERPEPHVRS